MGNILVLGIKHETTNKIKEWRTYKTIFVLFQNYIADILFELTDWREFIKCCKRNFRLISGK